MKPCPNCKQPVQNIAAYCPRCGMYLKPPASSTLLTGIAWLDMLLGFLALPAVCVTLLVMTFLPGIRLLILPITWLGLGAYPLTIVAAVVMRRSYPKFALGLSISVIVMPILVVGGILYACSQMKF